MPRSQSPPRQPQLYQVEGESLTCQQVADRTRLSYRLTLRRLNERMQRTWLELGECPEKAKRRALVVSKRRMAATVNTTTKDSLDEANRQKMIKAGNKPIEG